MSNRPPANVTGSVGNAGHGDIARSQQEACDQSATAIGQGRRRMLGVQSYSTHIPCRSVVPQARQPRRCARRGTEVQRLNSGSDITTRHGDHMTATLLKRIVSLLPLSSPACSSSGRQDQSTCRRCATVQATAGVPPGSTRFSRGAVTTAIPARRAGPGTAASRRWRGRGNDVKEDAPSLISRIGAHIGAQAGRRLEKMCDEVREGKMPLKQYLWLHRTRRCRKATGSGLRLVGGPGGPALRGR